MGLEVTTELIKKKSQIELENKFVRLEFDHGKWCGLYLHDHPESGNIITSPSENVFEFMIRNDISSDTTTNYGYPGVQSQVKNIANGQWPTDSNSIQWLGYDKLCGPNDIECLDVHYSCTGILFTISYYLNSDSPQIIREIKLYNSVSNNNYLYQVALSMPFFSIGEASSNVFEIYDVRNSLKTLRQPLSDFDAGCKEKNLNRQPDFTAMDSDFHHEVSFVLQNSNLDLSLVCWGASPDHEAVSYYYKHRKDSISFTQAWFPFCLLNDGRQVSCKRQVIDFCSGDWSAARNSLHEIKEDFAWIAPQTPADLKKKVIYQVHGFIADFGGFDGLRRKLSHLKELGVDIIYLPPLAPPEAYLNCRPDRVASCYGSDEEFKQLVNDAHGLGMEIIVDMIAHHIYRQAPEAENPEFIRYDECGNPLSYSIGAVLTETRNPDYQRFFIDCCRNLVKKYNIDGFRFDVAGFQLPNWDVARTTYERPGMGVLGQTELLQKLKTELDQIKPLIYLEEGMGINGFRYVSHGFIHLTKKLQKDSLNGSEQLPELIKKMQYIFEDKIFKERPGVVTMYHCKIHDTVLMQNMGIAISGIDKAMTALIMTADGVPLITQGMERGYFSMINCLSAIKKQYPEFSDGTMNFDNIVCDNNNIFTFSRKLDDCESIVVINFSGSEQECNIIYPAIKDNIYELYPENNIFSYSNGKISLRLSPFACKIFKLTGMKRKSIQYESQVDPIKIVDTAFHDTVLKEDDHSYHIYNGNQKITVQKSNAMISKLNNQGVENRIYITNSLSTEKQEKNNNDELNEGSFSGTYTKSTKVIEDVFMDDTWTKENYDESNWLSVFVPKTRLPYSQTLNLESGTYIEDIIPNALNVLWTRHPVLQQGKSYFRKSFECKKKIIKAQIDFVSPAMYDFDLAVQNGGVNYPLMEQSNLCSVYINGKKVKDHAASTQIAAMLKVGNNVLAVESQKGCGAHGILGYIKIEYADGTREVIRTDSSWKCFPGTIFEPKVLSSSATTTTKTINLKFSGVWEAKDNTSLALDEKNTFNINYCFYVSGDVEIKFKLSKQMYNLSMFWELACSDVDYWFAENQDDSFLEKIFCWNDVRNAYSGSILPVWNSNEFKMTAPLKLGLIQDKSLVQCSIENDNSLVAEIFSGSNSGVISIHTKNKKLAINLTNKGVIK